MEKLRKLKLEQGREEEAQEIQDELDRIAKSRSERGIVSQSDVEDKSPDPVDEEEDPHKVFRRFADDESEYGELSDANAKRKKEITVVQYTARHR